MIERTDCTYPDCRLKSEEGYVGCEHSCPFWDSRSRDCYEAYWDGWNDACDANIQITWWSCLKRAIAELKR